MVREQADGKRGTMKTTGLACVWGIALSCLLAALPLQAQEAAPPQDPVLPASPEAGVSGRMSDAWITTRIRAALVPLQRDGAAQVRVATLEGMVTLEGQVADRVTRDAVVAAAAGVRDVRGVDAQALLVGTAMVP